jgi:5,10-methylenetetrahydromethanopterin reductase
VHERGVDVPAFLKPMWQQYCKLVEATAPELRHLRTHEFHYTYLHPGEADLITADLIRATCLVGNADYLVEQIQELERQGLQEIMWATATAGKWRFAEDFARQVMSRF